MLGLDCVSTTTMPLVQQEKMRVLKVQQKCIMEVQTSQIQGLKLFETTSKTQPELKPLKPHNNANLKVKKEESGYSLMLIWSFMFFVRFSCIFSSGKYIYIYIYYRSKYLRYRAILKNLNRRYRFVIALHTPVIFSLSCFDSY